MKKKIKLLATIASLCLAIGLMTFGVYAAASVTVSITSSVTYSVGANVAFEVYGAGAAQSSATTSATTETLTTLLATVSVTSSGTESGTAISAVALDATNSYAVYSFYIKNIGSTEITNITITDATGSLDENLTATPSNPSLGDGLAQNAKSPVFSIAYSLDDMNTSVTSGAITINIAVS